MARDPARRRRRYRSAALARLGWNDIHPCPAKTAVDLFSACNVRSPSVMASYLERNVSDERATSIAASPLQISQPNGRPGGPRRLVTSRNGDALSMPTSMPASKACTVPWARDGNRECQWRWISNCFTTNPPRSRATLRGTAGPVLGYPNFRSNRGRKSEAAHDGFRPTTCTRLTSAVWQAGQSVASVWRCALPATRERCSAISSAFSSLSCRGHPAPSRTPAPVGDGYSCWRALRGLWLFGAVLQGLRGAF